MMINLTDFDLLPEARLQQLLDHPAVQAGVAPFLAALLSAGLLRRFSLSGLSIIAGFAVMLYLASDFTLFPLTAPRKIALLGLLGAALGVLPGSFQPRWLGSLLPLLGGAAAIWTAQRILQQHPLAVALLWGGSCAAYVAWLVLTMDNLGKVSERAAAAAAALGIGTGGAALVGASALLGQFGLAVGSAALAWLLIHMISGRTLPAGRAFTLPVALLTGLTGCIAVLSAELPWYALPALAAIPLAARWTPLPAGSIRLRTLLCALPVFACAVLAIFITWRIAGDVPF